jgi:hypothetical protein
MCDSFRSTLDGDDGRGTAWSPDAWCGYAYELLVESALLPRLPVQVPTSTHAKSTSFRFRMIFGRALSLCDVIQVYASELRLRPSSNGTVMPILIRHRGLFYITESLFSHLFYRALLSNGLQQSQARVEFLFAFHLSHTILNDASLVLSLSACSARRSSGTGSERGVREESWPAQRALPASRLEMNTTHTHNTFTHICDRSYMNFDVFCVFNSLV